MDKRSKDGFEGLTVRGGAFKVSADDERETIWFNFIFEFVLKEKQQAFNLKGKWRHIHPRWESNSSC